MNGKTLILGGVRSGKTRLAERLGAESAAPVTYVATASADDEEMRARIDAHRAKRPADWALVEEPLHLGAVLETHAAVGQCVIVDCLTLWLTNLLCSDNPALFDSERAALIKTLPKLAGTVILVGNETNMGITPLGPLSRRYCDEAGLLHQELAEYCDHVTLCVAGLRLDLK